MFGENVVPEHRIPLSLFSRLLRDAQTDPFAVYQIAAAVQVLFDTSTEENDAAIWDVQELIVFASTILDSISSMRRHIAQPSANVGECAPALLCMQGVLEAMNAFVPMLDLEPMTMWCQFLKSHAMPAALLALDQLAARPNVSGYLMPSLAQLAVFTMTPTQLYEGPAPLMDSHTPLALHSFMSRMIRASLCSTYFEVIQGYGESQHQEPIGIDALLPVLERVAHHVVLNPEYLGHFQHPRAVMLVERSLRSGVMNRFVNGGPLDTDELRERDFFLMVHLIPCRLLGDWCKTVNWLLTQGASTEALARLEAVWLRISSSVSWADPPLLLEREQAELMNPRCTDADWRRVRVLLEMHAGAFMSALELASSLQQWSAPTLGRVVEMERSLRWVQADVDLFDAPTPRSLSAWYRKLTRVSVLLTAVLRVYAPRVDEDEAMTTRVLELFDFFTNHLWFAESYLRMWGKGAFDRSHMLNKAHRRAVDDVLTTCELLVQMLCLDHDYDAVVVRVAKPLLSLVDAFILAAYVMEDAERAQTFAVVMASVLDAVARSHRGDAAMLLAVSTRAAAMRGAQYGGSTERAGMRIRLTFAACRFEYLLPVHSEARAKLTLLAKPADEMLAPAPTCTPQ